MFNTDNKTYHVRLFNQLHRKFPLNTARAYTESTCKTGCKVYIPVNVANESLMKNRAVFYQELFEKAGF